MDFNWSGKKVLVTGGASFISSHLIDRLVEKGADIRVVDDLSSGKIENIQSHFKNSIYFEFVKGDLREPGVCRRAMEGIDVVFHLAGDHGGRGYVDLHQAGPSSNLLLDGMVFWEATRAGVEKIVYASSGCVYPTNIQSNPNKEIYLTEDMVKPPHDADNMYGWAKLMGEETLKAYHNEYGIKTASCRFFTVYGPRGKEDHAIIAIIARAFIKQNPFEVWGNGQQIRNWTYVDDIVRGMILTAEKVDDGKAINLGTMERIKVIDAVKKTLAYTGHKAKIKFLPSMPTGPVNRVADNSLAKELLGWQPEILFEEGLKRTIDWYFSVKKKDEVEELIKEALTER